MPVNMHMYKYFANR